MVPLPSLGAMIFVAALIAAPVVAMTAFDPPDPPADVPTVQAAALTSPPPGRPAGKPARIAAPAPGHGAT